MIEEMNNWQEKNNRYLASALHWLLLRLRRLAGPESEQPAKHVTAKRAKERRVPFIPQLGRASKTEPPPALPEPSERVTEEDIAQAAQAMRQAEQINPPPALVILAQRLGLSQFEREVLLLCAAIELDTRTTNLCALAHEAPNRPYPTFALAMALFDDPSWDVLSPERPLRYWQLVEINQPGAQPLTTSPLRADERILNSLKGLNYLDDRLTPLLVPFEVELDHTRLSPSQQAAASLARMHLSLPGAIWAAMVVQLVGPDSLSKQLVAQKVAQEIGLHLVRMQAEILPTQANELENLARLWRREVRLLPVALYLDTHEISGLANPEGQPPAVHRFLARSEGTLIISTRDVQPGLGSTAATVEVDKPTPTEQQDAWAQALGTPDPKIPSELAGQFNLNLASLESIAKSVLELPEEGEDLKIRVWNACRLRTRPRMDLLAQRLDVKAKWNDLVLPKEQAQLLEQIADQVGQRNKVYDEWGFRERMNRGLGITVLFSGESGTGKTMAAEVIANRLNLDLYRIDLSAVINKYIGETEKNLRRVFDAAEDGGALLFFDEADALFGKRSEVKDSHDRYANIETSYLLQRMEAYRGLAVLATNMKSALDQAFLRRLRFIVVFPFPGPRERKLIWEKVFPPQVFAGNGEPPPIDFERLARFNLTGGSIHNIAINAAFLAAGLGQPVEMQHVLMAIRTEFRKMERPINEADFK
jgi:hypothetical protein